MKKQLLSTAALALIATSGFALDVEMFGQVNKSLMTYDDGQNTDTNIVDNNNAQTGFGIQGEQMLDNGLTASVLFSVDMVSNGSSRISQNGTVGQSSTPLSAGGTFEESMARVGLAGEFGALFLGQQDTAIDDAFYHDLAAAGDVMGPGFSSHGGNLGFRNAATGALVSVGGATLTSNAMNQGFDGSIEEEDSIRYNSPSFNGFNFSISTSQGGDIDTNLRYSAELATFEVDAAFGYGFQNSNATTANDAIESAINASVSVSHETGFAGTVAYAKQSLDNKTAGNDDPEGYYVKLGYQMDNLGFAVDYATFEDGVTAVTTDHELTSFGVGAQYDMGNGVSAGALYRNYDADVTGINTDAIDVFALNMKVTF